MGKLEVFDDLKSVVGWLVRKQQVLDDGSGNTSIEGFDPGSE